MRSRCAYCEHYTCTCRPEPKQSIQVTQESYPLIKGSAGLSEAEETGTREGSPQQLDDECAKRLPQGDCQGSTVPSPSVPSKALGVMCCYHPRCERDSTWEIGGVGAYDSTFACDEHKEYLTPDGSQWSRSLRTQTAEQERPLVDRLKDALRDYRDEHHAEHPSQPSKLDCAYTWCQRATRLLSAKESPAARQVDLCADGKAFCSTHGYWDPKSWKQCPGCPVEQPSDRSIWDEAEKFAALHPNPENNNIDGVRIPFHCAEGFRKGAVWALSRTRPDNQEERESDGKTVAELRDFYDKWGREDGNSPGYNLQKAKLYGRQARFFKLALHATWEDMPEGPARERAREALDTKEWPEGIDAQWRSKMGPSNTMCCVKCGAPEGEWVIK